MRQRRLTIATTALLTCIIGLVGLVGLFVVGGPALGLPAARVRTRVDIVKVSGLIDPINADLVSHSIRTAESQDALLLVLQFNSTGGTIGPARVAALVAMVKGSSVPVTAWVGGSSRARAYGPAFALVSAAVFRGEAPGSRVGKAGPLPHSTMSGDDAVDAGFLTDNAPTIVDFLGDLSGHVPGVDLGVTGTSGVVRGFRKDLTFNFSQLSIIPKLLHTAASPDVAFVMLIIALALVVFEFFTAGVGVAAGTGAVFGVLSAYGLGVLPTHWWAVVLLSLSVLGFAIDVQAGAPRFWTVFGIAAYLLGALALYGGGQSVSVWIVIVLGLLLGLFMVNGMPAMVRTRFSTPTIGRESLVGTLGVAVSGVEPEGTVKVNGAPWRARTNRATPIPAGEIIRVVAIDGLLLEVEPESGGARDAHH